MVQTDTLDWRTHWTTHPLVRAFVVSLALHVGVFTTLEVGNRLDLWRFSPLVMLAKALKLESKLSPTAERLTSRPILTEQEMQEREREIPIQFVDVDPTQAATEAPANTKYYSSVSSVAGNRDTSRDAATPQIDGAQDKILKTMDSERARTPQPMQPAPVVPQQPQDGRGAEPVKPQPVVAAPARPAPENPPTPEPQTLPPNRPGETMIAKLNPAVAPPTPPQPEPQPTSQVTPRTRPRTVAAALAQRQLNPSSTLVGEKMKQEGGVKRFSISSSLDVQANALGSYDAKFIAAVQQCWFALLEEQRYSLDRVGKVVLDFRLTPDGRITDMKVAQSDVGEIYTTICELAITKPAPYEKWPNDVRKLVGGNFRDVRFTFYY